MLEKIMEEYGDQLKAAVEVILFILLVAGLFFGGALSTIITNLSNSMC